MAQTTEYYRLILEATYSTTVTTPIKIWYPEYEYTRDDVECEINYTPHTPTFSHDDEHKEANGPFELSFIELWLGFWFYLMVGWIILSLVDMFSKSHTWELIKNFL